MFIRFSRVVNFCFSVMLLLALFCIPSYGKESITNLIVNGSFEIDDDRNDIPDNWELRIPFTGKFEKKEKTDGLYSYKMTASGNKETPWLIQYNIPFNPDTRYEASVNIRGEIGTEVRLYVDYTANNKWAASIGGGPFTKGKNKWIVLKREFQTPSRTDMESMCFVLQIKGEGAVYFDEAKLIKINKPELVQIESQSSGNLTVNSAGKRNIPKNEKCVWINDKNFLMVKGKPFFPMMLSYTKPNENFYKEVSDAGFNTIRAYYLQRSPLAAKLILEKAMKYNLMVSSCSSSIDDPGIPGKTEEIIRMAEVCKDNPAFLFYMQYDEPAHRSYPPEGLIKGYNLIATEDPYHPVLINFAPNVSAVSPDRLKPYLPAGDIISFDIYPIPKEAGHSYIKNKTIGCVGDYIDLFKLLISNQKPVMVWLQAFSWEGARQVIDKVPRREDRTPNYVQLRFMAYQSIIRGARGLVFQNQDQDFSFTSKIWETVKSVSRELNKMLPVITLMDESPKIKLVPSHLEGIAKTDGSNLYIIVANNSESGCNAKIYSGALPNNEKIKVFFENNRVQTIKNNEIEDYFAPWEVKVYSTNLKYDDSLEGLPMTENQNKINKCIAISGIKVSCSSEYPYPPYFPVQRIIDGKYDEFWNDGTIHQFPDIVEIEFPSEEEITEVRIYTKATDLFGQLTNEEGIKDYSIYIRSKDSEWKRVITNKNNHEWRIVHSLDPIYIKGLKLEVNSSNGGNEYSRITEIEIY
ncbi:carbohydrate binding domain-containing protein [bacterium]|nr:carbohydrate binding domain-containing protein [bacterium]